MVVRWNKVATRQLIDAIDFIEEAGFYDYALELERNILSRIRNLPENPLIYPIDKFRKDNEGNYRAFEVDNYRISYRVRNNEINIVRVRRISRRIKHY